MKRNKLQKHVVIDCQVFQTASWHRGMGKYSHALLDAISKNKEINKSSVFVFVINDKIDLQPEIRELLAEKFPNSEILSLPLELPQEPRNEYSIVPTINRNKQILTKSLASIGEYDFMILALYLDEVCPVFPDNNGKKILVYYDAIPYLYYERYNLFQGFFDNFYFPHTATMYEATDLLTISETVANDLCIVFGIPQERITNINGAAIERELVIPEIPKNSGIQKNQYILMPTGQELRKNNKRAVQGFAVFKQENPDSQLKLVITSSFTDEGKMELQQLTGDVIFTDNVSEGSMKWLFDNCRFLLFPSEYEGLGLPVLEAIDSKKQIACSDISVFREISLSAFTFFDPHDPIEIAHAITKLNTMKGLPDIELGYKSIKDKYTWANTAKTLEPVLINHNVKKGDKAKKKIAIFSPDASGFSAIGKVVTESHARYSEYFDIVYYFDRGPNHRAIRPNPLAALAPCFDVEEFTESDYASFDAVIYHIGNSEYHLDILHAALAFPGYVILHDTFLEGAYHNMLDLGYISQARFEAEVVLDKLIQGEDSSRWKSNFLTTVTNGQLGVITHSEYAQDAVSSVLTDNSKTRVKKINLPVATPMFPDITKPRMRETSISFAGIIASVKGTAVMEDIANSEHYKNCRVNIFGYSAVEPEQLERLKILPHVNLVTNPSDYSFQALMSATNILVNVRLAYKGETSLTTLESMRFGGVAMVRDFGWYSELPSNVVVKVESVDDTLPALRDLVKDNDRQRKISLNALNYIKQHHSHKYYAAGLYDLIIDQDS